MAAAEGPRLPRGVFLLPSLVLGGGRFVSLLGKIHAFCTVDLNKNGTLCTFEFRNDASSDIFFWCRALGRAVKTDKLREAHHNTNK